VRQYLNIDARNSPRALSCGNVYVGHDLKLDVSPPSPYLGCYTPESTHTAGPSCLHPLFLPIIIILSSACSSQVFYPLNTVSYAGPAQAATRLDGATFGLRLSRSDTVSSNTEISTLV
jgi:hypothetical protein